MIIDIKSPTSGIIGKIHVNMGDSLAKGDELLSIETNKGNTVVKAKNEGIIEEILVSEGSETKAGDILIKIKEEEKAEDTCKIDKTCLEEESDITIIGGGPGGCVAAIKAAQLGAKVVLIEKDSLGGTCLNWGCIPTKAFVRSAEIFENIKDAENFGIETSAPLINMEKIVNRKNSIVTRLVEGIQCLIEKNKIRYIKGSGKIANKNLVIAENEESIIKIKSKNIIIATGSTSAGLNIPGVNSKNVLTSKEILDINSIPKKLTIIGGGVIGMEFAFIFSSFGAEVSVLEYFPDILCSLDEDIINEINLAAKEKGIKISSSSNVEEIYETEDNQAVVKYSKDGVTKYITSDKVLMSVGRKPYTDGIGLENAGIELNKKGIKVNLKMQTNVENIYAIGDVTNIIQLAHVASRQGIVAAENIMGQDVLMDYSAVPSAIFTSPEIAAAGISEKEAKSKGVQVKTGKFPYAANGKALTLGDSRGFIKVIKDVAENRILGASIIGAHATDLIAELTLAINNNIPPDKIIDTIHAHPTTAEIIPEAVMAIEGVSIHSAE
ncbi:MAG: dihydrolipoyl dehydrogenase [Bacillota bacterium]|nr:dihydrolipoyl dehydrogenase [Bacillota bacterium]